MNVRIAPTGRIVHETSTSGTTKCGVMHATPDDQISSEGIFALVGASETPDEVDCMACIVGLPVDTIKFTAAVPIRYIEFTWTIK